MPAGEVTVTRERDDASVPANRGQPRDQLTPGYAGKSRIEIHDVRSTIGNHSKGQPLGSPRMAAPGGTGPIGPYPSGVETDEQKTDYDKLRRRLLWSFPSGLYVIGSRHELRRNLMTANWVTQVSFEPKLVAVSVDKHAFTHELIDAGNAFTVNILDREDRAIVRKFTKPVDVDTAAQTLNGFAYHDGAITGVPILDDAVAFVECEVRNPVDVGGHTLFIGEVVNAAFQKDEETPVLRMEDTRMNYGG